MRGLSVEFIANVLPKLIAALGDVHGHFCTLGGKVFCGCKDAKDCPASRGGASGYGRAAVRRRRAAVPWQPNQRPGLPARRPSRLRLRRRCARGASGHRNSVASVAASVGDHVRAQEFSGEHTGRATIMLSYTWGYSFGTIGSALMAYCAKHGLDPRTTHVWICCMCINQHRVAGWQSRANADSHPL